VSQSASVVAAVTIPPDNSAAQAFSKPEIRMDFSCG
jgi:hypothetical protein